LPNGKRPSKPTQIRQKPTKSTKNKFILLVLHEIKKLFTARKNIKKKRLILHKIGQNTNYKLVPIGKDMVVYYIRVKKEKR